jgi:hypothetical protein
MQMWMIHESLAPGMQDRNEAHLRSKVLGIFRQFLDALRCGPKKDGVDHILVSQGERLHAFGHGKDRMKVGGGKQILFPGFKPSLFIQALAFGAMAVPAGVVGDPQPTTMITLIHMAPKLGGATNLNRPHGT